MAILHRWSMPVYTFRKIGAIIQDVVMRLAYLKKTGCSRQNWNWRKILSGIKRKMAFHSILSRLMDITGTMPILPGQSTTWVICICWIFMPIRKYTVSYTHLRAHETRHDLVCRL